MPEFRLFRDAWKAHFLIVLLASVCVSFFWSPQIAAGQLFIAGLLFSISTRQYFHPSLFLTMALGVYLLFGGLNLSTYRGDISDETFREIFLNIASIVIGALIVNLDVRDFAKEKGSNFHQSPVSVSRRLVLYSMIPGVLGVLWIVASVGFPVLNPSLRFGMPAKATMLAETLLASFSLLTYRLLLLNSYPKIDLYIAASIVFLLLIPGYRGWVVIALGIFLISAVSYGRIKMTPLKLAFGASGLLLFLSAVQLFRRMTNSDLVSGDEAIVAYDAQGFFFGLEQIHFGLRESIALSQRLIEDFDDSLVLFFITFGDLISILPGEDVSGGKMVGELFGSALEGGLTPGASGLLHGIGWGRFLFLGIVGIALGSLWRKFCTRRSIVALVAYSIAAFYCVHWFHRGVIKLTYVAVPAYFFFMAFAAARFKRAK